MPTLTELHLYPIKSCGGIALREATLTAAGLMSQHVRDRQWMVVDARGNFLTQREFPNLALVIPRLQAKTLEVTAPGMPSLETPLELPDSERARCIQVQVWEDSVTAFDCGETCAGWFSAVVGTPCRLVRFHPSAKRFASAKWTAGREVPALFSDGFPMLIISAASLADLNTKLLAQGRAALPMNRFRPSVVIGGTDAFEEDFAESIRIGDAVLKPVKPCPRCAIPSVDQTTGVFGPDPLDILQTYRANPRIDGGIAFGMNTILLEGEGEVLRVGQEIEISLGFGDI
ncbi:MOSC N-terminal beta barrel domain-containing protein [soil metagenome]